MIWHAIVLLFEGAFVVTGGSVCGCWTPAYQLWTPAVLSVPGEFCQHDPSTVLYTTDGPLAGPDVAVGLVTLWCDLDADGDVDVEDLAEFQLVYPDVTAWNARLTEVAE